jgi:hypothetical protein
VLSGQQRVSTVGGNEAAAEAAFFVLVFVAGAQEDGTGGEAERRGNEETGGRACSQRAVGKGRSDDEQRDGKADAGQGTDTNAVAAVEARGVAGSGHTGDGGRCRRDGQRLAHHTGDHDGDQ